MTKNSDLRKSTEGDVLLLVLEDLLVHVLGLISLHYNVASVRRKNIGVKSERRTVAGRDGVHSDALVGPLSSERPCEVADRSL